MILANVEVNVLVAAEAGVLIFLTFFQLAGALILFRTDGPRRTTYRYLAALLVLNAVLSTYEGLRADGLTDAGLQFLAHLWDLPSAAFIAAIAFTLVKRSWAPRAAQTMLGIGVAQVVLAAMFPSLIGTYQGIFQVVPYYAASSFLVLKAARGETWEKWIALAFLPRCFYFITPELMQIGFGTGWGVGGLLVQQVAVLGLLAVCLAAVGMLIRGAGTFVGTVTLPTVLVGPAIAFSQLVFPDLSPASYAIHNWFSLGLVRPLFLYVGLARQSVGGVAVRSTVSGVVAFLATESMTTILQYPTLSSWMLGIAVGLITFSLVDVLLPTFWSPSRPSRTPPSTAIVEAIDDTLVPYDERTPQWQRLLMELRGSSKGPTDAPANPAWTQKALAQRTGISVKRISEFPQVVNATAAQKLAAHVPGWVEPSDGRDPVLVEPFKGVVRGSNGAWVYYRLTADGERLAEHITRIGATTAGDSMDSGRIPDLAS